MKFTAKQIASFINGEVIGNENAEVYTFAKIEEGTTIKTYYLQTANL